VDPERVQESFEFLPRLIWYTCCSPDNYVRLFPIEIGELLHSFFLLDVIGSGPARPKYSFPSTDPPSYVLCVRYFLAKCPSKGVYGDPGLGEEICM
jgi:hypothetical protein